MKKVLSILIAVIIAIAPSLALGEVIVSYVTENDSPFLFTYATVNGKVYSGSNNKLYCYNDASKKFESIATITTENENLLSFYKLFSDGEKLILSPDEASMQFYHVDVVGDKAALKQAYGFNKIYLEDFDSDDIVGTYICDNFIYALYSSNNGLSTVKVNKQNGDFENARLNNFNPRHITEYKDDKILFFDNDSILEFDGGNTNSLIQFSDNQIRVEKLLYDKLDDRIFIISNSFLYLVNSDGTLTKSAFISRGGDMQNSSIIGNNLIVAFEGDVKSYAIDPNNMPEGFIKVYGLTTEQLNDYNDQNPTLPAMDVSDQYIFNVDMAVKHMQGENACDVYIFNTSMGLEPLIKHGYIDPITSSTVNDDVKQLYPFIQKALIYDGKTYLYPWDLTTLGSMGWLGNYSYNKEVFDEIGLSEADVPKTFGDLLNFIDKYQKEIKPNYPDVLFIDNMPNLNFKQELLERILSENSMQYEKRGELVSYNNPTMLKLLNQLNQTDFYGFNSGKDDDYSDYKTLLMQRTSPIDFITGYVDMPLALDESTPLMQGANIRAFAINTFSNNKDNAQKFVQLIQKNLKQELLPVMYPSKGEPIVNPDAQKQIEIIQKIIDEQKLEVEKDKKQGGKNVANLEESMAYDVKNLNWWQNNTYLISPEELAYYKQNINANHAVTTPVFDSESEQIISLFKRYTQKNIDTQSFLIELDRYVTMMTLEGK